MKYNFDKLTYRDGTFSYKWNVKDTELPMWVADMDFEVPPTVKEKIVKRAENGIFGYTEAPDEFFCAVSGYFERRHAFKIPTEWMVYSNGVVAAISAIVRKLTTPAENVLIQAPVYNIFYNSILNNGRNVISSDLVYKNGEYSIDFADLEEKLSDRQTSLMIVCNPHNPVGRVWTREELAKIGELCYKHGVTVLSDEIHCDFVKPPMQYIPFASVNDLCSEISVSCVSASKTFNIAGLQSACVYSKNPFLRHKAYRGINTDEVGEPNAFSMIACIEAFTNCDDWAEQLNEYIWENKRVAADYIAKNINGMYAVNSEATYLLWVDVSEITGDASELARFIREKTGLYIMGGESYGVCGRPFLRINVATQRQRLLDGLERLKSGAEMFQNKK